MGKAELLYIALAIVTFTIFSSTALRNKIQARMAIVYNEIELSAYSQSEAILNQAWTKNFDQFTYDNGNDNVTIDSLVNHATESSDLGFDTGEDTDSLYKISYFNDLDDFDSQNPNSFKVFPEKSVTINVKGVDEVFYKYKLKTKVDYVDIDGDYTTSKTKAKKLTVLIEITSVGDEIPAQQEFNEDGRSTPINETWHIQNSKIFYYYPDYHGLDHNDPIS